VEKEEEEEEELKPTRGRSRVPSRIEAERRRRRRRRRLRQERQIAGALPNTETRLRGKAAERNMCILHAHRPPVGLVVHHDAGLPALRKYGYTGSRAEVSGGKH
jgi:hypothetical protein